jgi:hypothetical protein
MKSHFFTKFIIDDYSKNINANNNGVDTKKAIMNLEQIMLYFADFGTSDQIVSQIKQSLFTSQDICADIHKRYIELVLDKTFDAQYVDYDVAFMVNTEVSKNIDASIIALVIVQRKECNKFANAYALNLICSRKCVSCGNVLVGLYLYTVLSHPRKIDISPRLEPIQMQTQTQSQTNEEDYLGPPILHMGILEISGGFKNTSALCLYTKFGFVINATLSGPNSNCFADDNNIAMIKRFSNNDVTNKNTEDAIDTVIKDVYDVVIEKEKILRIVRREEPGYRKHIICEFKDNNIQRKLGKLYNDYKAIQKTYAKLVIQARFPINKIGTDFTPEFRALFEGAKNEMDAIQTAIDELEAMPRDVTLTKGGHYTLTKGVRKLTKKRILKKRKPKKCKTNRCKH